MAGNAGQYSILRSFGLGKFAGLAVDNYQSASGGGWYCPLSTRTDPEKANKNARVSLTRAFGVDSTCGGTNCAPRRPCDSLV